MAKPRQQKKTQSTNRVNTSISVDPEAPNQIPEEMAAQLQSAGSEPAYEDIQRRAYQIHEEKGGSDLENWLEAERVLKGNR